MPWHEARQRNQLARGTALVSGQQVEVDSVTPHGLDRGALNPGKEKLAWAPRQARCLKWVRLGPSTGVRARSDYPSEADFKADVSEQHICANNRHKFGYSIIPSAMERAPGGIARPFVCALTRSLQSRRSR
jgi:hypothetical protein